MTKTGTSLFQKILFSVNYFFLTSVRMRKKNGICFEHFQNYQYLKQSHLWKTLMIQVVSLALVFLKLVGFFTVHYRVNILQWFPRMNLVHCGLRNWGKSWIQRFLCLNLWLLIFSWSKMYLIKAAWGCLLKVIVWETFCCGWFSNILISCSHSAVRRGTTTISWSLWGSRCTSAG